MDDLEGYRGLWDGRRRRADSYLFWPAMATFRPPGAAAAITPPTRRLDHPMLAAPGHATVA